MANKKVLALKNEKKELVKILIDYSNTHKIPLRDPLKPEQSGSSPNIREDSALKSRKDSVLTKRVASTGLDFMKDDEKHDYISNKKLKVDEKFDEEFRKIKLKENRFRLKQALDYLANQGLNYKYEESSDPENELVKFTDENNAKKGEIKLKIIIEQDICSIGFEKSKNYKKVIGIVAKHIDKSFEDALQEIIMEWKMLE